VKSAECSFLQDRKPAWKATVDAKTGKTYYYHSVTKEVTWTRPADFDTAFVPITSNSSKDRRESHKGGSLPAGERTYDEKLNEFEEKYRSLRTAVSHPRVLCTHYSRN